MCTFPPPSAEPGKRGMIKRRGGGREAKKKRKRGRGERIKEKKGKKRKRYGNDKEGKKKLQEKMNKM